MSANCEMCDRQLTKTKSRQKGVGPVCEHKKESFLKTCGSSLQEIAQLSVLNDSEVLRWIGKFAGAMRARRADHARRFLEAAREACQRAQLPEVVNNSII